MQPRPERVAVFHSELKAATQGAHYEICPGEQDNGLYFMTKDIVINEDGCLVDFKSNSYVWITGADTGLLRGKGILLDYAQRACATY